MMNALERRSTFALSSIFALRMLGLFMIIPVFSVAGQAVCRSDTGTNWFSSRCIRFNPSDFTDSI